MAKKFYAVKVGRRPGLYGTWAECEQQVKQFRGAQHKSFASQQEAEAWLTGSEQKHVGKRPSENQLEQVSVRVRRCNEANSSSRAEMGVYTLEYDGAAKGNPGPAGAGAILRDPNGIVIQEIVVGLGSTTNNVAEYRALIAGLRAALKLGIDRIKVQGDSNLVCQQVNGNWKVNMAHLQPLCQEAQKLRDSFVYCDIRHIDREFNSAADSLANRAVGLPEEKFESCFTRDEVHPGQK